MPDTQDILILANSARRKGYCVAGKLAVPLEDGTFDIKEQWIRLTNPDGDEGAVPYAKTLCPAPRQIQPLDIVRVQLKEACNNPDHPEDWYYEPAIPWQVVSRADKSCLPIIADKPAQLWNDGAEPQSVHEGFVRTMSPHRSSICLIPAPPEMDFCFWNKSFHDPDSGSVKKKPVRELSFNYKGIYHEFSVTDPAFMKRHNIWNRITDITQLVKISETSNYFLCLSLGLAFRGRHYKIGATIFEP